MSISVIHTQELNLTLSTVGTAVSLARASLSPLLEELSMLLPFSESDDSSGTA